jgi:hypothetical protein
VQVAACPFSLKKIRDPLGLDVPAQTPKHWLPPKVGRANVQSAFFCVKIRDWLAICRRHEFGIAIMGQSHHPGRIVATVELVVSWMTNEWITQ